MNFNSISGISMPESNGRNYTNGIDMVNLFPSNLTTASTNMLGNVNYGSSFISCQSTFLNQPCLNLTQSLGKFLCPQSFQSDPYQNFASQSMQVFQGSYRFNGQGLMAQMIGGQEGSDGNIRYQVSNDGKNGDVQNPKIQQPYYPPYQHNTLSDFRHGNITEQGRITGNSTWEHRVELREETIRRQGGVDKGGDLGDGMFLERPVNPNTGGNTTTIHDWAHRSEWRQEIIQKQGGIDRGGDLGDGCNIDPPANRITARNTVNNNNNQIIYDPNNSSMVTYYGKYVNIHDKTTVTDPSGKPLTTTYENLIRLTQGHYV